MPKHNETYAAAVNTDLRKLVISSCVATDDGATLGPDGGGGPVGPVNVVGGDTITTSVGNSKIALCRQSIANSKVGTGTAYDWLSALNSQI